MKKKIIIMFLLLCTAFSLFSVESKIEYATVRHMFTPIFGGNSFYRGFGIGSQVMWNHYRIIYGGLQNYIEFDSFMHTITLSIEFLIGFGPDIWITAGHTSAIDPPYITDGENDVQLDISGLFNTFGLGAKIFSWDFLAWQIEIIAEAKYLLNEPVEEYSYNEINEPLVGLKVQLGVSFAYSH